MLKILTRYMKLDFSMHQLFELACERLRSFRKLFTSILIERLNICAGKVTYIKMTKIRFSKTLNKHTPMETREVGSDALDEKASHDDRSHLP